MTRTKDSPEGWTAPRGRDGVASGAGEPAPLDPSRAREIRREVLLVRALQSRVVGPVLRAFGDPQKILEQGMAFWSSRVVLAAVEFGLFTELAGGPLSAQGVMDRFGWHPR